MTDSLRTLNQILLGLVIFFGAVTVAILIFAGAPLIAQAVLPILWLAGGLALAFWIFVVLPLSIIRQLRVPAAICSLIVSYVFGATLWTQSLLLAFVAWGPTAVLVGVLFAGIGVVPIALAAMAFSGTWNSVGELLFLILLTYGSRFFAIWIGQKADEIHWEAVVAPKPQEPVPSWSPKVISLNSLNSEERQVVERMILEANQKAEAQYTEKEKEILARHKRRSGRPTCCKCGMTYGLNNIYICRECEAYYCYNCVWDLEKIEGPSNRWKCPCGGELW
jgi:hypothetical protein